MGVRVIVMAGCWMDLGVGLRLNFTSFSENLNTSAEKSRPTAAAAVGFFVAKWLQWQWWAFW